MGPIGEGFDPHGPGYGVPRRPAVRFSAIGEGWELFKARWATWIVVGLIVVAGNGAMLGALHAVFRLELPRGGGGFRLAVPPAHDLVPAVIVGVVNGVFVGAMFRVACLQIRGRRTSPGDLLGVSDVLGGLVVGSALMGFCVALAATVCLAVPAFILAGVWMFTIPLIVDGHLRAVDAVGQSWRALRGQWLPATVFHLAAGLVAVIGGFCLCFGLFLTLPLYSLSISVLYRDFFLAKGPDPFEKPVAPDPYF
jgi:hypothetical protein